MASRMTLFEVRAARSYPVVVLISAVDRRILPALRFVSRLPFAEPRALHISADPEETREWIESLDAVTNERGPVRARYLLAKLLERAHQKNLGVPPTITTPYVNSIPPDD